MKDTNTTQTQSEKFASVSMNPLIGSYIDVTQVDLRTPESLNIDDVLDRQYPMKFYPAQIVPIIPSYNDEGRNARWTSDRDIMIREGYSSSKLIGVGDELAILVDLPANGDATSATSYKVMINGRSFPLLHFIPETVDGGALNDVNHYDAYTQMINFDDVLLGEVETPQEAFERKIQIVSEMIPDQDFWVSKPRHAHGFESPQKVIRWVGGYQRLRGEEYDTTQDDVFNVWGEYATKYDCAWDIVSNARVILKELIDCDGKAVRVAWDAMYDYLTAENKRRYKLSKI